MLKNYSKYEKESNEYDLFHLEDAKAALLDGGGNELRVFE